MAQRVISTSDDDHAQNLDLETGSEEFTLNGHTAYVNALALTDDGKRVISASNDKTLKVWNLETGSEDLPSLVIPTTFMFWRSPVMANA
jgi:WD40 repeat protein